MFDKYPYTNFHELNLEYFIQHFKEIFDEWEELYNTLTAWKDATDAANAVWKTDVETDLATWKANVEAELTAREDALRAELEAWKDATETDIGTWETDTLATLETWKASAEAAFEVIRLQAAASATAAAGSATAAATSETNAAASASSAATDAASIASSAAQIAENTSDIADLKNALNETLYKKDLLPLAEKGAYYITSDYTINTSTSWESFLIPIEDYYLLEVSAYSNNGNYMIITFYSESTVSNDYRIGNGITYSMGSNNNGKYTFNKIIIPPDGAKYLLLCNRKESGIDISLIGSYVNTLDKIFNDTKYASLLPDIIEINLLKPYIVSVGAYYVDANSDVQASSSWESFLIPADKYYLLHLELYSNNQNYKAVTFYNSKEISNSTMVGNAIPYKDGLVAGSKYTIDKQIMPPVGAKFILVSSRKSSGTDIRIIGSYKEAISKLSTEIEKITNLPYQYTGEKITVNPRLNYYPLFNSVGQDGAVYGDKLIRLSESGVFVIIDIPTGTTIYSGTIGSWNVVHPHCNSVFFGNQFYDVSDPFPILYLNGYNGTYADDSSLPIGVLFAHRITKTGNIYSTELIQTIDCSSALSSRANFALDKTHNFLLSICYDSEYTIIKAFDMPIYSAGDIVYTSGDENYTFEVELISSMQGCKCINGKVYMLYGTTNAGGLKVIDIARKSIVTSVYLPNMNLTFEPQFIDEYINNLLIGGSVVYHFIF